ncbi:helix-turn-helix domain-containing protein [Xenorhabdus sp. DI]|uniref:helix-turn-helix domain-containing protein n=1 Tax=Xenorhabdus doucetiae TaxID=351671 RepID=UPI0019AEABC2|nr:MULTISPECIES: helix-turn-helix domain-containing protein [unclassified Xenorhabdus]MBD2786250.1 helix-turn-helix domain-containing protein [Xenorhabdus sp. 3]MBD2788224.1 helix-turn-helix domain-containing protein [Xenorhabdus sp. DI]
MTFTERLNRAMREGGFSQGSLAKAVGMAQSSVWKLTSGTATRTTRLVDIARVLGVRPEWLSDGKEPMRAEGNNESGTDIVEVIEYKGMFPVDMYDGDVPTGDQIMIPDLVESSTCKAYKLHVNSGCAEAPAGATIVIDSNETAGTNDLIYARVNKVLSVYRFVQGGSHGFLSVDDSRVPLIDIGNPDVEVFGVVVYIFRNMRHR